MPQRSPELSRFITSLNTGIKTSAPENSNTTQVTERIMSALKAPMTPSSPQPHQLPLCNLLHGILDQLTDERQCTSPADGIHPSVASHAQAMKALSPKLTWWVRPDSLKIGEPFASGHANAIVVGPGGLEERDDVQIGISLIAPYVTYPDHHHAPEEVYLVLSPGHWRQNNDNWHEPGIGSTVHNQPNVYHAMRSGKQALLATWCLWMA